MASQQTSTQARGERPSTPSEELLPGVDAPPLLDLLPPAAALAQMPARLLETLALELSVALLLCVVLQVGQVPGLCLLGIQTPPTTLAQLLIFLCVAVDPQVLSTLPK